MIRYNRIPSASLLKLMEKGKVLSTLTDVLICKNKAGLPVYDVQFREKDTVSIYCGTTEVAKLKLTDNYIKVTSAGAYSRQPCAYKLMKKWEICKESGQAFKKVLYNYLDRVVVDPRYWKKEGQVQVRWEQRCGRNWNSKAPFAVFDREVVLGYDSDNEKKKLQNKFIGVINLARKSIDNIPDKRWARCKSRNSNELDLIGVSNNGRSIVLIEVKHHSATSGEIYYSPLQILYYMLEWKSALESKDADDILKGINRLIKVKKMLGVLPADAPELIYGIKPDLKPIIAVDKIGWSDEVDYRLRETIKATNRVAHDVLKDIQIWEYSEGKKPSEYHLKA